jgi:hypothetical protein
MADDATGSILINLVDGARKPLPASVQWSATVSDGRAPSERQTFNVNGAGAAVLVRDLPYFDNLFDAYTVVVSCPGYQGAAWKPVNISPAKPAALNAILLPTDGHLNFANAAWDVVSSRRPRFAQIISAGINNAPERYGSLMETQGGAVLACMLNLLTAMSQITLPSGKSPIDYYWQPIWDNPTFAMAQDRFFAYADKALIPDVVAAAKFGAFAEEQDPGIFHPGSTLSYKQVQFDVTNVQLTFHQGNTTTVTDADGNRIECIVVEPDIDYYKDLLAHFFLEVIPNKVSSGLTDPRQVYVLRWMAGKQAGLEFDPLYTYTT